MAEVRKLNYIAKPVLINPQINTHCSILYGFANRYGMALFFYLSTLLVVNFHGGSSNSAK